MDQVLKTLNGQNIVITNHAIDRFKERFYKFREEGEYIDKTIIELFNQSEENHSFLNNSTLLEHLYENYGYGRHQFYVYQNDILFVCRKADNLMKIITCMNVPNWITVHEKYKVKKKFYSVELEELETHGRTNCDLDLGMAKRSSKWRSFIKINQKMPTDILN